MEGAITDAMQTAGTYSTRLDADVARITLDGAGVPSVVVGVDASFEGGSSGVKLLVPDEYLEAALKVLGRP